MLVWLIGIAVFVALWAALWRAQPKAAFGVLLGLPIAWILSRLLSPYVTGMKEIPLWLAPAPIVLIAITLFIFGIVIWLRADKIGASKQQEHDDHGGGDGHH